MFPLGIHLHFSGISGLPYAFCKFLFIAEYWWCGMSFCLFFLITHKTFFTVFTPTKAWVILTWYWMWSCHDMCLRMKACLEDYLTIGFSLSCHKLPVLSIRQYTKLHICFYNLVLHSSYFTVSFHNKRSIAHLSPFLNLASVQLLLSWQM